MVKSIDRLLDKAREIAQLEQQLDASRRDFEKMAGVAGPSKQPGVSVSQQVLTALAAGPRTRAEIVAAVGHPAAVHSALKKHQSTGRIVSVDGRWSLVPTSATMPTPVQVRKPRVTK